VCFSLDAKTEAWVGKAKGERERDEVSHRSSEEEGLETGCLEELLETRNGVSLGLRDVFLRVIFFFLMLLVFLRCFLLLHKIESVVIFLDYPHSPHPCGPALLPLALSHTFITSYQITSADPEMSYK